MGSEAAAGAGASFQKHGGGQGGEEDFFPSGAPFSSRMGGMPSRRGQKHRGFREIIAREAGDAVLLRRAEKICGIGGSDVAVEVDDGDGMDVPHGGIVAK